MADTRVLGLAELKKTFLALPAKVEGNVMRGALRSGANVFKAEAKRRVAVDDGDLNASIRVSFDRRSQRFGVVRARIVAGGKKAFHAHFVEYGTATYYTGKGRSKGKPYAIKPKEDGGALFFGGVFAQQVTHPGMRPQPFMRPAVDSGTAPAIDAVVRYIRTRLPKEIKKAGV